MKKRNKIILVVIGIACFFFVYHFFDPSHSAAAPKCPFWLLTGYRCPGCGSQRALHAFLNGRIWEGIQYNYLLVPLLLYVVLLLVAPKGGKLHEALSSATACIILAVVLGLWWIVRNLIGC